jgi:hypothetical protein
VPFSIRMGVPRSGQLTSALTVINIQVVEKK